MDILLDVDGVLADFAGGLCLELKSQGFERSPEEMLHWTLARNFTGEEQEVCEWAMAQPGFCFTLDWYPGAREFVQALNQFGTVHALTAPFLGSSTWMHERMKWLQPTIPQDRVHFVSGHHKHLVRGNLLIEDHPANAAAWLEAHPRAFAILIDRPWNSDQASEFTPHDRLIRAESFQEALALVELLGSLP